MFVRANNRRCKAALIVLPFLGIIFTMGVVVFWVMGNVEAMRLAIGVVSCLVLIPFFVRMLKAFFGQSPSAKVDRLLYRVLQEAGERNAKSVTFVLNYNTQSLYVDIDAWVAVSPCKYNLTTQLGNLIMARHNVTPHRLSDGLSYAYFLTPNSAK